MTPKFSWKKDLFDSEILGFPCAKIERLVNGKLTVEELIRDLKMNKIEYAVIRILGKDYVTAQLLESNGFRLVDSLVFTKFTKLLYLQPCRSIFFILSSRIIQVMTNSTFQIDTSIL
jgi:hypothetical protein